MYRLNVTFYTMQNEVSKGHIDTNRFAEDDVRAAICREFPHFLHTPGLCALIQDTESGESMTLINSAGGIICS